jgi:hypothetical protein
MVIECLPAEKKDEILSQLANIKAIHDQKERFKQELETLRASSLDVIDGVEDVLYGPPMGLLDWQKYMYAEAFLDKCFEQQIIDFYEICSMAPLVMRVERFKEVFLDMKEVYNSKRIKVPDVLAVRFTDPLLMWVFDWELCTKVYPFLKDS